MNHSLFPVLFSTTRAFKKKRAGGLGTETSTYMSEVLALALKALVLLRHKAVNGSPEVNRLPLRAFFRGPKMA